MLEFTNEELDKKVAENRNEMRAQSFSTTIQGQLRYAVAKYLRLQDMLKRLESKIPKETESLSPMYEEKPKRRGRQIKDELYHHIEVGSDCFVYDCSYQTLYCRLRTYERRSDKVFKMKSDSAGFIVKRIK